MNAAFLLGVGVIGAARPLGSRFQARFALNFERAALASSTADIGSARNVYVYESVIGPVGALSFGYVVASRFVLFVTGSQGYLVGKRSVYTPLTFGLQGSWTLL